MRKLSKSFAKGPEPVADLKRGPRDSRVVRACQKFIFKFDGGEVGPL
jgi:hypothetical protein